MIDVALEWLSSANLRLIRDSQGICRNEKLYYSSHTNANANANDCFLWLRLCLFLLILWQSDQCISISNIPVTFILESESNKLIRTREYSDIISTQIISINRPLRIIKLKRASHMGQGPLKLKRNTHARIRTHTKVAL